MAADFLKGVTIATMDEITADIEFVFSGGHDLGHGSISVIEHDLFSGFAALPKNDRGLVERPALNYLVHRYFMKEYGWDIRGLHSNGAMKQVDMDGASGVLVDDLPSLIEQFLEKRSAGGFSIHDAAIMVSTLDHVIQNEHMSLLRSAYELRGFNAAERHAMSEIHDVITSYRVIYSWGGSLTDRRKHSQLISNLKKYVQSWNETLAFFTDAVQSHRISQLPKSCPFAESSFSFDDTWKAMSEAMRSYGAYENIECQQMKRILTEMDPEVSGRVPLGKFYENAEQFAESVDYLRHLGSLDESSADSSDPQLLISNYVLSRTNCVGDLPYYGVCCMSECEILMDQLFDNFAGPTAEGQAILSFVEALPSSTVLAPRNLSEPLVRALWQVSDFHDGRVPLHGRLFAQWMHYAYPHECPYPHASASTETAIAARMFKHRTGMEVQVSSEEKVHYFHKATVVSTVLPHMSQWTFEEELRLGAPEMSMEKTLNVGAWMAQAAIVACFCVAALKASARMLRLIRQGSTGKLTEILV